MIKQKLAGIAFVIILVINILYLQPNDVIYITNAAELQKLFMVNHSDLEVHLQAGSYELLPTSFVDNTCGNCDKAETEIPATFGLQITGRNIKLLGPEKRNAIIKTNSGYGIFVHNSDNVIIENLVITGGIRDSCADASDAAIVVKNSTVVIENNLIKNNLGDSLLVKENIVGIMGICGRENSHLTIQNNEIIQNSWDGIALYRDAKAIISGNIIDGIKKETNPKGGRGVGIGVTWNAEATIRNNLIKRYWKGIGIFVDGKAVIEKNVVENMVTWGISVWDAGKGKPQAEIKNNIIYNCGAMGAAITSNTFDNPGFFTDNFIIKTAQDSIYDSSDYYGYQCALARHSIPDEFLIERNIFYQNRIADEAFPDYDLPENEFNTKLETNRVWILSIENLEKSDFYRKFLE